MMDTWDVFIAYHGSYENTGSKQKAKEISDWLKGKGIRTYFFDDDETNRFGETPGMAAYSTLFLLVANQDILVNYNGEVTGTGLLSELKAFYNKKVYAYKGRHTLARVYCYDQCTAERANDFHMMFNNVDHFEEGRDGEEQSLSKLYDWIVSGKNEIQNNLSSPAELRRMGFLNLDYASQFLQIPHLDGCANEQMLQELSELYSLNILGEFLDSNVEQNDVILASVPESWNGFNPFRFVKKAEALQGIRYIVFCKGNAKGILCYDVGKRTVHSFGNDLYLRFQNGSLFLSNQKYNLSFALNGGDEVNLYSFQGYESEIEYKEYEYDGQEVSESYGSYTFSHNWAYALEQYSIHLANGEKYYLDEDLIEVENNILSAIRHACYNISGCKKFYNYFRSTAKLTDFKHFDEPAYKEVALSISDFCQRKDPAKLRQALSALWTLYENATSYYEKENLLLLFSEIVVYNIFTLSEDYITKHNLFERLVQQAEQEILPQNKLRCIAYCCFIAKEMLFGGNFQTFATTFKEACEYVLERYDRLTKLLEHLFLHGQGKEFDEELYRVNVFLYRQRAVIWEELGDEELDSDAKREYYQLWQQDSMKVIEMAKERPTTDKEIAGCAYLNYASSLTRFSQFEPSLEGKRQLLNQCLENLELAEKLLINVSAQRMMGYVYLHKADCYNELVRLFPDNAEYDKSLLYMAMKADGIFKRTDDYNARGWILRIIAKGKMKQIGHSVEKARECLTIFRQALQFSMKTYNANVMLNCIHDLTLFMHLIRDNTMMDELYGDFQKLFADELMAFANIIRQVEITTDKIFEIQEALYEIYMSKNEA